MFRNPYNHLHRKQLIFSTVCLEFNVGDILKSQEITYSLNGRPYNNDSAYRELADFLNSHKNITVEIGSQFRLTGTSKQKLYFDNSKR